MATPVRINIYYDTRQLLPNALAHLGQAGRGQVVMRGHKFGAVWDGAGTPVDTFTPASIKPGTLRGGYMAMDERATHIDLRYRDEDKDYTWQTVPVERTGFDPSTDQALRTGITVFALTSRQMVWELGRFLMDCNEHLIRTLEFESGIKAFDRLPGDVIWFGSSVPGWTYGGRVVSADATSVTLDQTVTVPSGTCYVTIMHASTNTVETVETTNAAGDTNTLTVAGWTATPAKHDEFLFGPEAKRKKYRLTRISRTNDLECKLVLLEYSADVYGAAGDAPGYDNPEISASVDNLSAAEQWDEDAGTRSVRLSWQGVQNDWDVYYQVAGAGTWTKATGGDVTGSGYGTLEMDSTDLTAGNTYNFLVTWDDNTAQGEQVTLAVVGNPGAPAPPTNLELEISDDGFLEATWQASWLTNFDVRIDSVVESSDQAASSYTHGSALSGGTRTVEVRGQDAFGTDSPWTSETITVDELVIDDTDLAPVICADTGTLIYDRG